jgi:pimeloyl-ACP methyl ester carboxylesterase
MAKPLLVLIPGIGDDRPVYQLFARVWRWFGFEVHVIPFGWKNTQDDLRYRTELFEQRLRTFGNRPLHLIGISAGGSTAVRMLAMHPEVQRVITISTPYELFPHMANKLLHDSIVDAKRQLERLSPQRKQDLLSILALFDETVPTWMSRPNGVTWRRTWSVFHAPSIFVTLVFGVLRLRRFLVIG